MRYIVLLLILIGVMFWSRLSVPVPDYSVYLSKGRATITERIGTWVRSKLADIISPQTK